MLVAVAFVLSYIESMLPLNFGVPGIKAGLSNIVVLFSIFKLNPLTAFCIAIVRIVLCGITLEACLACFTACQAVFLSFVVMLLLKKTKKFSVYGVSVAGGVSHNIGQILVAVVVLNNRLIMYYFPFLLIAGIAAGIATGMLGGILIKRFRE